MKTPEKIREHQERYAFFKEKRLKHIKKSKIKDVLKRQIISHTKENGVWVLKGLRKNGRPVELRQKNKQSNLNDLATISGYKWQ